MLQKRIVRLVTLGENYMVASLLYFGLGLLVLALVPESPVAHAGGDLGCPQGQAPVWIGEQYECRCP